MEQWIFPPLSHTPPCCTLLHVVAFAVTEKPLLSHTHYYIDHVASSFHLPICPATRPFSNFQIGFTG